MVHLGRVGINIAGDLKWRVDDHRNLTEHRASFVIGYRNRGCVAASSSVSVAGVLFCANTNIIPKVPGVGVRRSAASGTGSKVNCMAYLGWVRCRITFWYQRYSNSRTLDLVVHRTS